MFKYSIDSKPHITDPKGNVIVDLTRSMFSRSATVIHNYDIKRMSAHAVMRPDLVSLGEYGHTESAEFILKYSGVSNPFTLDEEDVLLIPNEQEADNSMVANNPDPLGLDSNRPTEASIRNYFQYVNQDYKSSSASYDALEAKEFKSAIPDTTNNTGNYAVPYFADDRTAITIRNGRMFFGEDAGITANTAVTASTTNLDAKIQAIIDSTATALSDSNCLYNGVTLANFVKANTVANTQTTAAKSMTDEINQRYDEQVSNLKNS